MPQFRYATAEDAALIAGHRHRMFQDNALAGDDTLTRMDAEFEPWVRDRLLDGRYVGLLIEEEGRVIAGAGIFFADFPPHWMHLQPLRAYVLNVYTVPDHRGKGLAQELMRLVVSECQQRAVATIVLHASPMGKPIYEKLGFVLTSEMMLRC